MARLHNGILAGAAVTALAVVSATGCADNNSSLFIMGVVQVQPPDCTASPNPSGTFEGEGTLDVALGSEHRAFLLVGNQLTPRGAKQRTRSETARVSLTGAEVTLETSDGRGVAGGEFTVPGSGFIDVNRSETPGWGLFLATLIPSSLTGTIQDTFIPAQGSQVTIVASVRVFGETLGGEEIESGLFSFPITVCNGCLIYYPLEAIDSSNQCTLAGTTVEPTGCFAGQSLTDCRLCSRTNETCLNVPAPQ